MTALLERAPEMSVDARNFATEKEESTMTASAVPSHYVDARAPRRARARGLDRLIMRLSLATLLWARRHADRTAITREEQVRIYRETRAVQRREHDAALLVARVR